ncbi:RNA polymerase sigma factor FliA [Thiomicrospira microaerophila]|uniref:RNA polymerase sigma factor FliA n=1 Tax=Thiomicrospira microaerophila TaxID=406020 RepID=UPI0005CAE55D|nr:RNA polymerase sigma factor FliA [Thiomicrospira microaerophila]
MRGTHLYNQVQSNCNRAGSAVEQHLPLVKKIAYHLKGRLPDSVFVEDLIQAGVIGLIEALQKYSADQGASFETYAGIRIRGAMLDEIRKGDWTPRSVHRKSREVSEAIHQVESRLGREARDSEVAEAMGLTLEEYHHILMDTNCAHLMSIDEPDSDFLSEGQIDGHGASPLAMLTEAGFKENLAQLIAELPEKEALVMALYYDEELNLKEIGLVLEVSESRVSQIHSQAIKRLRARMSDWL